MKSLLETLGWVVAPPPSDIDDSDGEDPSVRVYDAIHYQIWRQDRKLRRDKITVDEIAKSAKVNFTLANGIITDLCRAACVKARFE